MGVWALIGMAGSTSDKGVSKLAKKRTIMGLAGAWADNGDYWDAFLKQVYEDRKKVKMRDVSW